MSDEAISVDGLTYQHKVVPGTPLALKDLSLHLAKGSRTLLVGANGGTHQDSMLDSIVLY